MVLLPNVAVAENCCVLCGRMKALDGDNDSETICPDGGKNPPQLLSKKAVAVAAANLLRNLTDLIVFSALCLDADPTRFPKSAPNV